MKLTKRIIQESKKYPTPFLLIEPDLIKTNYQNLKKGIDGVEVFYAMKANDHPKISEILFKMGSSFEISSLRELRSLLELKVPAAKIICLNPIKSIDFLKEMNAVGVEIMAFDSLTEVDKIAKFAPSAKLVLRVTVDNEGSDWPLTKKFGIDASEAISFLEYAKKKGVKPVGLTFHVGSQCLNKNNWVSALYICDNIWNQAKSIGINFNFLSLGGGVPVQHLKPIPSVWEIGKAVSEVLKNNFKSKAGQIRVTIEPGRGIVGESGVMVTKVIGKAKRGSEDWVYLDVGVFNGLMETIQNFQYEIKTEKNRSKKMVTIAGPSCDSVDIPFENVFIPEVKVGDYVYIMNAAAYTTVYAANFNGFHVPETHFLE